MAAHSDDGIDELTSLGFTELEARVYTYLVEASPVTAYRIAQGIGKTAASTYKAVESLQEKGAILLDERESRLWRAVPPEELLGQMERSFASRRQRASQALARLKRTEADEGVYALPTRDLVLQRARALLKRAETVVLIDAFPGILTELRSELEAAAARGVRVVANLYQPPAPSGIESVWKVGGEVPLRRWPGQWLTITVDRAEVLLAYLTRDGQGVHQAYWSPSVFLAWVQHSYLAYTLQAARLERLITEDADGTELKEALAEVIPWLGADSRGQLDMRRRFGEEA